MMQVVETFVIMYGHVWMEDEVKVEQLGVLFT